MAEYEELLPNEPTSADGSRQKGLLLEKIDDMARR